MSLRGAQWTLLVIYPTRIRTNRAFNLGTPNDAHIGLSQGMSNWYPFALRYADTEWHIITRSDTQAAGISKRNCTKNSNNTVQRHMLQRHLSKTKILLGAPWFSPQGVRSGQESDAASFLDHPTFTANKKLFQLSSLMFSVDSLSETSPNQ